MIEKLVRARYGCAPALAALVAGVATAAMAGGTAPSPPLVKRYSGSYHRVGEFTTVRGDRYVLGADRGVVRDVRTHEVTARNGCMLLEQTSGPRAHERVETCYTRPVAQRDLGGHYLRFCRADEVILALVAGRGITRVELKRGRRRVATLFRLAAPPVFDVNGSFFVGSSATPPTRILGRTRHGRPVVLRPYRYMYRHRRVGELIAGV